jgi:hypothetical protein
VSLCKPKFRQFPWAEYPAFCNQLVHYGLTDGEAYELCETGAENLYYTNREKGWNNVFIETRLAPKKTFLNKVGEAFAQGTDCTCCLGYRIAFMTLLAAVGWIAFFLEKL